MLIAYSVDGVPIRLRLERWQHIMDRHPEMRGQQARVVETVSRPDVVQAGDYGTKMAVKLYAGTPLTEKYLVVVYREASLSDGFVITSYFTTKPAQWREVLWKR